MPLHGPFKVRYLNLASKVVAHLIIYLSLLQGLIRHFRPELEARMAKFNAQNQLN